MSKAELRVFVASPGGLDEERDAIEKIAGTLNANFSDRLNVTIMVKRFEQRAARSGRPQSQINPWVDECDVLIAVVHRRWGSPSGEGTQTGFSEEFDRAIDRYDETGSPLVSLHFKAVDQESQADAGPQLEQVIQFRRRIESDHVGLYKTFDNLDELRFNVYQLLVEEMHAVAPSSEDSAEDSAVSSPERNRGVESEPSSEDDESGIALVLETIAEVIRDGQSDNAIDIDRLALFTNAVAHDPETAGVHLTNRVFRRRESTEFSAWELEAWFRAYVNDHGKATSSTDRTVPFALAVGREKIESQVLDRSSLFVGSDVDQLQRGYLRLLRSYRLRPAILWSDDGIRSRWEQMAESGLSSDVVEYWAAVGTPEDSGIVGDLAQSESVPGAKLADALQAVLDGERSIDALVDLSPDLLLRPAIATRLGESRWERISDEMLADLAARTYISKDLRMPVIREIARRGSWPAATIAKLVKSDPIQGLFSDNWEAEARELLFKTADIETATQVTEAAKQLKASESSLILTEFAASNASFRSVFLAQAPDYLSSGSLEEHFALHAGNVSYRRMANQILAGTFEPANARVERLRASGAEPNVISFVEQRNFATALLYLVKSCVTPPRRVLDQLRRLAADKDATFRHEFVVALESVAVDTDIPMLLETYPSRWRESRGRLPKLLERATITRLTSMLDDESAEMALAALYELTRRQRPPTLKKRKELLRHKDASVRMAALQSLIPHIPEPSEYIAKYIQEGPTYFYNVVCELDRLAADAPI